MPGRRRSGPAHLLLLATVAVWGATFVVVKRALVDCSPLLFNQLRMLLASVALALVNLRSLREVGRTAVYAGAIAGVLLATGYELQTAGLLYTTASRSAFLTGLVVVLVPIFTVVPRLRAPGSSKPGPLQGVGALGAFLGIVLLTVPSGTTLGNMAGSFHRGDVLSLLCAVAFALHLICLSHAARRVPPRQLATVQIGFCALTMTVVTPAVEHPHLHFTASLAVALLICALFATAAAFSIQSWAQKHLQASHTAMILALEPAFALLFAVLFLGERLTLRAATGAAIVLGSLIATELASGGRIAEQPEANLR